MDAAPDDVVDLRDLALALLLTIATGLVDGIGFTRLFHVFPANQTGNLVVLGISIGDPALAEWWRPATAMVSFALGVAIATLLGRRLAPRRRRGLLLSTEVVLLVGVAVLAGDVHPLDPAVAGGRLVVVLVLAGAAMGLQTVVIGRVAGIAMSTTFETEAIVRLTQTTIDAGLRRSSRTVPVLVGVLLSYVAGAAIGVAVARSWGGVLWVAVGIVLVGALASTVDRPRLRPRQRRAPALRGEDRWVIPDPGST